MNTSKATYLRATWIGYLGLLMWCLSPVFSHTVKGIPTFEIISIAFCVGFLFSCYRLTVTKNWRMVWQQSWIIWVAGFFGMFLNDATYIAAFKFAPASHVDLINYLWPVFCIIFGSMLPRESFTFKHVLAALIGFSGIYILISGHHNFSNFQWSYMPGYLLGLADALVWTVYVLIARHYGQYAPEMVGMFCGLGLVFAIPSHFVFEQTVALNWSDLGIIIAMGLTTQGSAYFLWDYGIRYGNYKLLSILSYFNPIISIVLLLSFGISHLTGHLAMATMLVTLAAMVGLFTRKNST